jgi:hypothetical protein
MTSLFDWIEVYSAQDCIEANMLKGLLELDSIKVQLKGEALGGALGEIPFDQIQVKICVPQIKQRQAEKILLEYQSKHLVVCDWKCQNCNEYNGCGFEICWSCLKPK